MVLKGVGVMAFLLKNEPTSLSCVAWLSPRGDEAAAKASLNRAIPIFRLVDSSTSRNIGRWRTQDPKPGDLAMARMSPTERWEEVRTSESCNALG